MIGHKDKNIGKKHKIFQVTVSIYIYIKREEIEKKRERGR